MSNSTQTGEKRSLQDIMNMMARRVDGYAVPAAEKRREVLTEAEAYALHDPLLAVLLKEYRDAQGRHESLLRRHGADNAMVALAADVAGGADVAMETRLIELRACATTRRLAECHMQEQIEMMNASARYRRQMNTYAQQVADESRRNREHQARDSFFWMMMLWWLLGQAVAETQRRLSLARDFEVVSNQDRRAVA